MGRVAAGLLSELLDVQDDSVVLQGLSVLIFASMPGVGGAGQVPESNLNCMGTLGLGEGLLRVDKLLVTGVALAEGCEGLGRCAGLGMQLGGMQGRLGKVLFGLVN